MTRADFFKRVVGLCGLGALATKARSTGAENAVDLTVTDWAGGTEKPGYTFLWTGLDDNDWWNPHNWRCSTAFWIGEQPHPGEDPNRTDELIFKHGTTLPADVTIYLNSNMIKMGA